ncbi:MAG: phospho-N-acetylmuramoyl-pentapeptide-transferase [Parcubacteria group bacterium]|nr:phospho-N-acetylmuramoyl-pentapeptide-transferase [Parcubacteria group bacterium]
MGEPILQIVRVLFVSAVSFGLAMLMEPVLGRMLVRWGVRKQIRVDGAPVFASHHGKKEGTPTMGGILIWGSVLGLIVVFALMARLFGGFWNSLDFLSRSQTLLPLGAFIFAALIGAADDILGVLRIGPQGGGLRVREKVALYFLAAAVGAWWFYFKLGWEVLHIPFLGDFHIGFWYIPIFLFVITATSFSMNETDGLDGLAGGVATVAFVVLGVVAFAQGRYDLATFIAALLGALLAFLWFNIYPAKFFMGDTGSMALGVALGVISMFTNTAFLLPFFAFILVIESLSVIVQFVSKKVFGKRLFLSTPIHHHFEARGWHESRVTMRFWILSGVMASFGLIIFLLDRLLLQ